MKIIKIVSGGQTGADRGGLDAAISLKIPHGGWCPKGRLAEDGAIPDKYKLTETSTKDYLSRTEANVVDSDATLVFTPKRPTGGSLRTIEFANKHGKPWHHIALDFTGRDRAIDEILKWMNGDEELNGVSLRLLKLDVVSFLFIPFYTPASSWSSLVFCRLSIFNPLLFFSG